MERRIDLSNLDLDRAAADIETKRDSWLVAGLSIGEVTWMDNEVPWPRPIVVDRSAVVRPMSLGLRIELGSTAEATLVVYAGGWADVALYGIGDDHVLSQYVELESAEEVGPLVDRAVARLMAGT